MYVHFMFCNAKLVVGNLVLCCMYHYYLRICYFEQLLMHFLNIKCNEIYVASLGSVQTKKLLFASVFGGKKLSFVTFAVRVIF